MLVAPINARQKESARELLDLCNSFDGVDLPVTLEDHHPVAGITTEFVVLIDDQVVGFASLPDDLEPETCLFVHPDHRRKGIGTALLNAIRAECARRGHDGCLLVNDEASVSGRAFLAATGLTYLSSEYRLKLDRSRIDRTRSRLGNLSLRVAGESDRDLLIPIRASGFGDQPEEVAPAIDAGLEEEKRHFYLAELEGVPIGMIRAGEWDGTGDITSFAVLPEFRGKGYGRQIMLDTVDLLIDAGWERILIEVATDNDNELGLYESCGFRITTRYGFYRLSVIQSTGNGFASG